MRITRIIAICLLSCGYFAQVQAASNDCDRACLQNLLDTYMQAVAANNVAAAPLMAGYRQTENAVVKRLGTGVWENVTGLHADARSYLDPEAGQALWFGVVDTAARAEVAMIRIKVTEQKIAEAEWYFTGPGLGNMQGPAFENGNGELMANPEFLSATPPPIRNIPVADRLSRASLIGIANSYFDGITENDGSLIHSHPDCYRVENGVQVTGRPLPEGRSDGYMGKTNCASNMDTFNIALVSARRFFIVDEVQQVVVSSGIFMRNADAFQRRCVFIELFYIDKELMSSIYSVIYYPDPGTPIPNWAPFDGNFPLPESFGAAR